MFNLKMTLMQNKLVIQVLFFLHSTSITPITGSLKHPLVASMLLLHSQ